MTPAVQDDDDWVGTPPEGHHSRDMADPGYWRDQWLKYEIGGGLVVAILVLAILAAVLL